MTDDRNPFLGWYPPLVLFIPNLVLVSVLLTTYNARKSDNPPPDSPRGPTHLSSAPPSEGSVDYLANLVRFVSSQHERPISRLT